MHITTAWLHQLTMKHIILEAEFAVIIDDTCCLQKLTTAVQSSFNGAQFFQQVTLSSMTSPHALY